MNTINWVVGLLSLSAYGIGNTAFAYPSGCAPHYVGPVSEDPEDNSYGCPFSAAVMLQPEAPEVPRYFGDVGPDAEKNSFGQGRPADSGDETVATN
jgi:hypothetical protein